MVLVDVVEGVLGLVPQWRCWQVLVLLWAHEDQLVAPPAPGGSHVAGLDTRANEEIYVYFLPFYRGSWVTSWSNRELWLSQQAQRPHYPHPCEPLHPWDDCDGGPSCVCTQSCWCKWMHREEWQISGEESYLSIYCSINNQLRNVINIKYVLKSKKNL